MEARRPAADFGLQRALATQRAGAAGVTPASAETMAEEEGDGPGVQRANCLLRSRERGAGAQGARRPGSGKLLGVGWRERAGQRGEVCGEIQKERSEETKVLSAEVGTKVELRVGNRVGRAAPVGGVFEREGCEHVIQGTRDIV